MLKQDYVMRLVEKMGQLLAKLATRRDAEQHDQALSLVQQAYDELFGVDVTLVVALDPDSLRALAGQPEDLPWLARLMRHEADTRRALGDERAAEALALKALALFAAAAQQGTLDAPYGFDEDVLHLLCTTSPERLDPTIVAQLTPPPPRPD